MDDFATLDATAQAELVRRREVTPSDLVDAAIRRIERINPKLNAIVTPLFDEARAAAAAPPTGPFRGVPFLVKNLQATCAGARYTAGSRLFKELIVKGGTDRGWA